MMSQFILPWEHAFSPAPTKTATARLSVGGKTRNFQLRVEGAHLFFKEPSRAAIYAITREFEPSETRDSIGLISRFGREVAANNFGVLLSKRDYFSRLPVRAHILLVLKSDGSGWMREHFDSNWFLLPEDDQQNSLLNVWNEREVEAQLKARFLKIQSQLISRAIEPQVLETDAPRWLDLSGERIAQLLHAAALCFVPSDEPWNEPHLRLLKIKSHSAFARGDIEGAWLKHALHQERFGAFWKRLEPRVRFVGVRWSEGGEQVEQYGRSKNEKIFSAGTEKWGRFWRGNWAPQRARFAVELPDTREVSAHERAEAALLLREWLREDGLSEAEVEALLKI